MKRFVTSGVAMLLALTMATAQDRQAAPQYKDQDAAIRDLLKRVAELESKLELANKRPSNEDAPAAAAPATRAGLPGPAAPASSAQAPPVPATEAAVVPDTPSFSLGALHLRGFSDIGYGRPLFDKPGDGSIGSSTRSFGIGDLDLFVTANLSDHLSFLSEMLITSDFSNSFGAELDRLMLNYSFNDYFNFGFGKYNTAMGFYTNAFHRARYFQTATGRPIMFADEDNGGILPIHSVGLTINGKIPSGKLGFHYVAEVSNGRASHDPASVPVQNFADENNGKAINVAIYARPEWLHGFEAGVSVYRDRLHTEGLPRVAEIISTAHLVYVSPRTEFLNEMAVVSHRPTGEGQSIRSVTGYSQVSRAYRGWRPYFRYDYQNVPVADEFFRLLSEADPIFRVGRRNGPSAGIQYQVAEFAKLKCQFGRLFETGKGSGNDLQLLFTLAF